MESTLYGPIMPVKYLAQFKLSLGAREVFTIMHGLSRKKGYCWPSVRWLAEQVGKSVSSIRNYLRELVNAGLIRIVHRISRSPIIYLLAFKRTNQAASAASSAPTSAVHKSAPKSSSRVSTHSVARGAQNSAPINNIILKANSPHPPKGGGRISHIHEKDSASLAFQKISAAYPRREDLHTAERIWARLWRRKALPDSGILLACIEQAKKSEDWNKSGGKFIPWLKNFLRSERWKEWLPAALDHEKQQSTVKRMAAAQRQQEKKHRAETKIAEAQLILAHFGSDAEFNALVDKVSYLFRTNSERIRPLVIILLKKGISVKHILSSAIEWTSRGYKNAFMWSQSINLEDI